MNKQNKTYTAIDFAKYHAGTMPAKEMHALEKAALEDDFLADALEGYSHNINATNDLTFLQEKFATKKEDKKVFSLALFAKSKWMRIAAMVIVFVGLGYLFYNVNNAPNQNAIAKVQPTKETTIKQDVKVDSNNTTTDVASANVTNGNDTYLQKEKAPTVLNAEKEDQVAQNLAPAPTSASVITFQDVNPTNKGISSNATNSLFEKADDKGVLGAQTQTPTTNFYNYNTQNQNGLMNNALDAKLGGPKQNAGFYKLNTNASNQVVNTNKAKFTIPVFDSTANGALASNDLFKRKDNIELKKSVPVKMEEDKAVTLNEVVVTGNGIVRKSKEMTTASTTKVSNGLSGKVAGLQIEKAKTDTLAVLKSRTYINADSIRTNLFDDYVKKNSKPSFNDKGIEIKGTVLLSFKTNKNGKPVKIKIVQSLCSSCDAQAIQLLKDGPTWGKNINDRQQVRIEF